MRPFSVRTLLALLLGMTLMGLGFYFGAQLPNLKAFGVFPSGEDLARIPNYLNGVKIALGAIGAMIGALFGLRVGDALIVAGKSLASMSATDKIAAAAGVGLGALVSLPFYMLFFRLEIHIFFQIGMSLLCGVVFIYLGFVATTSMKSELFAILARGGTTANAPEAETNPTANCKILDTNVIIDGRIADVCRTGFIEGPLYVPGFVLEELQHIADSGDALKRARGRRGLDILNNMQKELPLIVRSWDKALDKSADHDEVDTRLVKLAKALQGVIVTNDFNLNKVAALQGVQVLNVNDLALALKPVVLPGEIMRIAIVKEGKEQNQGVAYLDDGTMIVVEDGRRHINETLNVVVTSVLQTVAGKMIFARVRSDDEGEEDYQRGSTRGDGGTGGNGGGGVTRRGPRKTVR